MWPECYTLGDLLRRKIASMDYSSIERRIVPYTEIYGMNPCGEILLDDSHKPVKRVRKLNSTSQEKEPQMSDVAKLVALADPSWEKDLKDLGIISDSVVADELRAEIEAQSAENRKTAVKEAASQILSLGKAKQAADQADVDLLRSIRRQEKAVKDRLAKRDEAWKYGSKSLNYLPLALDLNLIPHAVLRSVDPELLKVKLTPETAAPAAE